MTADWDDDHDSDFDCYECDGEGFISNCIEPWSCRDPEWGCDYCTHPCPNCQPQKIAPPADLARVLGEALQRSADPQSEPQASAGNPEMDEQKDRRRLDGVVEKVRT